MKHRKGSGIGCLGLAILAIIAAFSRPKTPAPATVSTTASVPLSTPTFVSLVTPTPRSAPLATPARVLPTTTPLALIQPIPALHLVAVTTMATPAAFENQVAASQKAAMKKYPPLGALNSEFNSRFVREYRRLLTARSRWLKNGNWPLWLADEVDARLRNPVMPPIALNSDEVQYYVQATPTPYVDYSTPWPTATPYTYTGSGSSRSAPGTDVYVRGYTRSDGTYVQPHTRSRPSR